MATMRITERVRVDGALSGARVDRERGVIYGVKLSGFRSENGNDYPASTFRKDIKKYEGVVVGFNHKLKGEPLVEDVGGRIRNARIDENGEPRGDAHLLISHPMTARVLEAAEKDPSLFGFSHVIEADCRNAKDGRQIIESIRKVISCDVVARPATTKGLYESVATNQTFEPVPTGGKAFADSLYGRSPNAGADFARLITETSLPSSWRSDSGVPTDGAEFARSIQK